MKLFMIYVKENGAGPVKRTVLAADYKATNTGFVFFYYPEILVKHIPTKDFIGIEVSDKSYLKSNYCKFRKG